MASFQNSAGGVISGTGSSGGNITVTNSTATFYGAVTVGAGTTFTVNHGEAQFLAGFVDNGTFVSDPSTSNFLNMTIGATGQLIGGSDDVFQVSGNMVNRSDENSTFDISQAELDLTAENSNLLAWIGSGEGGAYNGYVENFAVGTLELISGDSLILEDAGAGHRTSAGLYVGTLLLDGAAGDDARVLQSFIMTHLVNSISGNLLNIYYDPRLAVNAYLDDETFSLGGGECWLPPGNRRRRLSPEAPACSWFLQPDLASIADFAARARRG